MLFAWWNFTFWQSYNAHCLFNQMNIKRFNDSISFWISIGPFSTNFFNICVIFEFECSWPVNGYKFSCFSFSDGIPIIRSIRIVSDIRGIIDLIFEFFSSFSRKGLVRSWFIFWTIFELSTILGYERSSKYNLNISIS